MYIPRSEFSTFLRSDLVSANIFIAVEQKAFDSSDVNFINTKICYSYFDPLKSLRWMRSCLDLLAPQTIAQNQDGMHVRVLGCHLASRLQPLLRVLRPSVELN